MAADTLKNFTFNMIFTWQPAFTATYISVIVHNVKKDLHEVSIW